LQCDIKVKVILSVLCVELFVNAFAFLLKSKKQSYRALANEPNVFILHITSRPTFFANTSTAILQIAKLSKLSLKLPSSSFFNHQYHKDHTSPPSKSPYLYIETYTINTSSLATIFIITRAPTTMPLSTIFIVQ
jgi:hypothetical protein